MNRRVVKTCEYASTQPRATPASRAAPLSAPAEVPTTRWRRGSGAGSGGDTSSQRSGLATCARMATPPVTRLQRALAHPAAARRPTALDAFRRARRRFLAPERLDMSALADELGVNRVTLYRWFGSRDRFLVEVIWSLAR